MFDQFKVVVYDPYNGKHDQKDPEYENCNIIVFLCVGIRFLTSHHCKNENCNRDQNSCNFPDIISVKNNWTTQSKQYELKYLQFERSIYCLLSRALVI